MSLLRLLYIRLASKPISIHLRYHKINFFPLRAKSLLSRPEALRPKERELPNFIGRRNDSVASLQKSDSSPSFPLSERMMFYSAQADFGALLPSPFAFWTSRFPFSAGRSGLEFGRVGLGETLRRAVGSGRAPALFLPHATCLTSKPVSIHLRYHTIDLSPSSRLKALRLKKRGSAKPRWPTPLHESASPRKSRRSPLISLSERMV